MTWCQTVRKEGYEQVYCNHWADYDTGGLARMITTSE